MADKPDVPTLGEEHLALVTHVLQSKCWIAPTEPLLEPIPKLQFVPPVAAYVLRVIF